MTYLWQFSPATSLGLEFLHSTQNAVRHDVAIVIEPGAGHTTVFYGLHWGIWGRPLSYGNTET